jgi:DNA mismatch repair protein MutS
MINIKDLRIEKEILPLLNFTNNDFSKSVLIDILHEPLNSINEILNRQEILKGFIVNNEILKSYYYSRAELQEVYEFLNQQKSNTDSNKTLKILLFFSEKERHQKMSKFIQFILLFYKLHSTYISRLNQDNYPKDYKKELQNLNDFFNAFNLAHYELLIREKKIKTKNLREITKIILEKDSSGEFEKFWKRFFLFEAYVSISIGIKKQGFIFPTFTDTKFLLEDFYHPLLANPVKNSFTTDCNVVILTGPNMSGKSTFLKAISLCVYLGHIGIGVPAKKSVLPFFKTISVAINLTDNLQSGYSHFMTEVVNLKRVLAEVINNNNSFAVFDELFRGTNIEDAVEISTTTIKGLVRFKNSLFFISTHLHQLKEIEEVKANEIATFYIDCELKNNNPHFNYKLRQGWSDLKVGRLLFEREGLNDMLT